MAKQTVAIAHYLREDEFLLYPKGISSLSLRLSSRHVECPVAGFFLWVPDTHKTLYAF